MSQGHENGLSLSLGIPFDYTLLLLLEDMKSLTLYFGSKNGFEKYRKEATNILYYQPGHKENLEGSPIEVLKKEGLVSRVFTREPGIVSIRYSLTERGELKAEEERLKTSFDDYAKFMEELYTEEKQRKLLKLDFGAI